MKFLLALATATAAAVAPAQTCLTTRFAADNFGQAGGLVHFDVDVVQAISLFAIETNYAVTAGTPVGIRVWRTARGGSHVGAELDPTSWTLVGVDDGSATSAGLDRPTRLTLQSPIPLPPGRYGFALESVGDGHRYTVGTGANQTVSDAVLTITAGTAVNVPFTAPVFGPRVWNGSLCYTRTPGFAASIPFGARCGGDGPPSVWELFSPGGFDLANRAYRYVPVAGGYRIEATGAGIVAPVATPLAIGDDEVVPVALPWSFPTVGGTTPTLFVDSNGRIGLAPSSGSEFNESVAELLGGTEHVCPIWNDLNPTAGGAIHAEVDPSDPRRFHVTWLGVPEFPASGANDVQATFVQDGTIEVKYGACSVADCLVGYSPGGGSSGRAIDLTADLPLRLGSGRADVALVAVTRPVLGAVATSRTESIPAGATAGALVYGFTRIDPAIDLTGIGIRGCWWHVVADLVEPFAAVVPATRHDLPIPNLPNFAGASLYLQSVVVAPVFDGLGVATTNGLELRLDRN